MGKLLSEKPFLVFYVSDNILNKLLDISSYVFDGMDNHKVILRTLTYWFILQNSNFHFTSLLQDKKYL